MSISQVFAAIDEYDYDKLEKLHEQRDKKLFSYYMKLRIAKESGNETEEKKASKAILKHRREDDSIKEKAQVISFFWY